LNSVNETIDGRSIIMEKRGIKTGGRGFMAAGRSARMILATVAL
jgi:hypothetical protein